MQADAGESRGPSDRGRTWRDALWGIAALLVGVGLAFGVGSLVANLQGDNAAGPDLRELDLTVVPPPEAPSDPADTVARFLDAEVARSSEVSFDLLSDSDRARYGLASTWGARRAASLGLVTDWSWQPNSDALVTTVEFMPGLSAVNGWSPAQATITWALSEQDGWRILLAESAITPEIPDSAQIVPAAQEWLDGGCLGEAEATVQLLGPDRDLLGELCRGGGEAVGEAARLRPRQSADLALKYGADAAEWARTVQVAAAGNAQLILVPIGPEWTVIDAEPAL